MSRKVMDCRDYPNENNCTLTMAGEDDEVLEAAVQHAVSAHGHQDDAQLRGWLQENMKPEAAVTT